MNREVVVEKPVTRSVSWPKLKSTYQQTVKPFVARWWLWASLLLAPAYLTYFYSEASLSERVKTMSKHIEEYNVRVANNTRAKSSAYRSGAAIGHTIRLAMGAPTAIFCACLLMVVFFELYYRYVFRPLFESDRLGQGVFVFASLLLWLILVVIIAAVTGKMGDNLNLPWGFANSVMLLTVGYSFVSSINHNRKRQAQLLQQKTQAELDSLKAQVNPHFLFNSLNNIYGTALGEDSPRTAESIRQLADIVRYVMEESRKDTTDVGRELRFLDDYVELHRMRIPRQDNIKIRIETHWDEQPAQILPLLLNPLIENAFKYGISMQHPCFVNIQLFIENRVLKFTAENSIVARKTLEKGTGLGLNNVKKRLALAYPGRYTFEAAPTDNETFAVSLTIKL
jgi:two-component sensor histidine kinase